tara:strand:+ start:4841 stop:5473 length:633 start_codon:yes stop_codon:yes gene_type:complete
MTSRIFRLPIVLLFAIPVTAQGADQQKPNRNRGIVVLADSPAVHKELKLTERQVADVNKAVTEARQQIQKARQLSSASQRREKQSDATRALRDVLARSLDEAQHKRLFQIEIQWTSGAWMLLRQELRPVLELSKETRAAIRDLAFKSRDDTERLRAQLQPERRKETQQEIRKLLGESRAAALKLLSPSQKQKWEAAKGAEFKLPIAEKKK